MCSWGCCWLLWGEISIHIGGSKVSDKHPNWAISPSSYENEETVLRSALERTEMLWCLTLLAFRGREDGPTTQFPNKLHMEVYSCYDCLTLVWFVSCSLFLTYIILTTFIFLCFCASYFHSCSVTSPWYSRLGLSLLLVLLLVSFIFSAC